MSCAPCANRKHYEMTACSEATRSAPRVTCLGIPLRCVSTAIKSFTLLLMPVTDSRGYLVEDSKCHSCGLYLLGISGTQPATVTCWQRGTHSTRQFLTSAHSSQKVNTDKRDAHGLLFPLDLAGMFWLRRRWQTLLKWTVVLDKNKLIKKKKEMCVYISLEMPILFSHRLKLVWTILPIIPSAWSLRH